MVFAIILAYIFYAYGLTTIMVYGRGPFGICDKIRATAMRISDGLGELFSCPMCFSTWVGLVTSFIDIVFIRNAAFTPFSIILGSVGGFWASLFIILLDGFFTSGVVWLLHEFEEALERHDVIYSDELMEEPKDESKVDRN